MFLASILDIRESKEMTKALSKKLIKKQFQGDLEDVLVIAMVDRGIPLPSDFFKLMDQGSEVESCSLSSTLISPGTNRMTLRELLS
ncbi:hypothetical protein SUGI_0350210 [Cryptomeria japonica]|nr:hypothetical protein SUGI_0350210 [Cryptomeria japonica]